MSILVIELEVGLVWSDTHKQKDKCSEQKIRPTSTTIHFLFKNVCYPILFVDQTITGLQENRTVFKKLKSQ